MKKKILTIVLLIAGFVSLSFVSGSKQEPDECLEEVEVPKRFTPDGDGENDFLAIEFPCEPENFEFKLFNKEGEQVFATTTYFFQWAGYNDDGDICESGIYSWTLNYKYRLYVVERKGELLILS